MIIRVYLFATLVALLSCCALADAPPSAESQKQVNDIVATIDLANPASYDTAEDALVKGGDALLPAIKLVLSQKQTLVTDADSGKQQRQLGNMLLLRAQIEVLDRVVIRLTTRLNPPQLIKDWAKANVTMRWDLPRPMRIMDARLDRFFPRQLFYVVRFRQFPVARMIPAPLAANNVFAVLVEGKDGVGTVQQLTETKGLQAFFIANLAKSPPGKRDDRGILKDDMYSWLRIAQEFVQDGMLNFTIPEKSLTAEMAAVGMQPAKWIVNGEADVDTTGGNTGSVKATMWFDGQTLKLLDVQETDAVQAGIRPICQATKLLDPDTIVRRMAVQDLLFMGTAAEPYIMEQRAKATPELQAAIDQIWAKIVAGKR